MQSDEQQLPRVERSARALGVRVPPLPAGQNPDVHPDEADNVHPGEGMSVAPSLADTPFHANESRFRFVMPRCCRACMMAAMGR
jgi:hypothetical protein